MCTYIEKKTTIRSYTINRSNPDDKHVYHISAKS